MKTLHRLVLALFLLSAAVGCDAFNTLTKSTRKTAQGKPFEMVVVCPQPEWEGAMGDTLRAILTAPVPYLNQTEPLFDVLRVRPQNLTGIVADHRNILKINKNKEFAETSIAVQYDVTSEPQIILTVQGPDDSSIINYLSEHRAELVQALELAERNRAIKSAKAFDNPLVQTAIRKAFGVEMTVPKGYLLAEEKPDFIWARYEYPTASQGFFLYSYPYQGTQSLSAEALLAARNKFAAQIPGPSKGSYMTTSDVFPPEYRMFRLDGRLWCEMRGFWDVSGDFMGGPFVSYSTVDLATNRVFTLDCYVFSPNLHKRNFLRGVEDLLYLVQFPKP